jgi:chemotaxis protein MotB
MYDEARAGWTREQTLRHEAETQAARLAQENEKLRAQLRQDQAAALNASFGGSIQERMSELQAKLDGLNRPVGDIERFDVEGGYVFMIQDKVLFASGSAEIGTEGQQALSQLSSEIRSAAHGRIVVRGHTDSDPVVKQETLRRFPHGNLQLSAERAVSVAAFLIGNGKVSAQDVVVAGYGQWASVKPNDSSDNKRLNRRVEIFVADQ